MRKTTLAMSALALSLGLALPPLSTSVTETASPTINTQQISSLAPVLKKVMSSVVNINVKGSTIVNTPRTPRNFQQFFGDNSPLCQNGPPPQSLSLRQDGGQGGRPDGGQQQKFMALDFGVITDAARGCMATNNHVVDDTTAIKVQLGDGHKFDAKVVDKDPRSDIALIQVQGPKNPTVIKLADSDVLHVGDYTMIIDNPFGLGGTVAPGIVSALGRSGLNVENYKSFIQTGATTNRKNSGGTLVNLSGELAGINTAILAPDGGSTGIGFAIPSNIVKNLAEQMVKYGQVKRGELGIMGTELNFGLAKAIKVDTQRDAFVNQVMSGSAAAEAGIKAGDVITTFNSKAVGSFAALRIQVGTMPIGNKVEFGPPRDGKPVTVTVELQQSNQTQVDSSTILDGIEGAEMSNEGQNRGVVVNNVKTGTPAAQIGLEKGDIIVGANQQPVKSIINLRKIFDTKLSMLALSIQHGDASIYLLLQ